MKNWKLAYRITFWNCIIVIFLAALAGISTGAADDFAFAFGIVCLLGGGMDLFVGLILFASGSKDWGKGFLNSGGILLLLSGISCGTGFSNINFH